jgi:murein DD-endopeptidase MepM/ murein hydrolase activator NlpD
VDTHRRPARSATLGYMPKITFRTLLVLCTLTLCAPTMSAPAQAQPGAPRFTWPLSPTPAVTKSFQPPDTPYGPGHRGVDLAAAPGQTVLAAAPGVVTFSGTLAGRGVIAIDHDGDLKTTYEPVTPTVTAGTQVYAGQPIGTAAPGHPGCPVPACLHWGAQHADTYLNPLTLLMAPANTQLRLKPWEDPEPAALTNPAPGVP